MTGVPWTGGRVDGGGGGGGEAMYAVCCWDGE
jgi:hypothetical protein